MMNTNITNAMETTANAVIATASVEPTKASEPVKTAEPAKADKPTQESKTTTKAKESKTAKAEPFAGVGLNLTDLMKSKGKEVEEGKKYKPLKKTDLTVGNECTWDLYRYDVDAYQNALFDYSNGGTTTVKTLDVRMQKIMIDLGLSNEDRTMIIKTMGRHTALLPKSYRQPMTEEGREQMKALLADKAKKEQDTTLSPTARNAEVSKIEDDIAELRKTAIYESTMFNQLGDNTFRKQCEQFIAHRLIDLSVAGVYKELKDKDKEKNRVKDWQKWIAKAQNYGVKKAVVDSYKKSNDLAGFVAKVKAAKVEHDAKIEAKAKKTAKAEPKK